MKIIVDLRILVHFDLLSSTGNIWIYRNHVQTICVLQKHKIYIFMSRV